MQHAQLLLVARFEVPLKALREAVHIALVGVVNAKALNRCHHYHGTLAPVGGCDVGQVFQHTDLYARPVMGFQRLAVRVAGGLQGLERLAANRVAGHQPYRDRGVGSTPLPRQHPHRMRRHQRLAPARGNAQAHARHLAKRVRVVGAPHQLAKRQGGAFLLCRAGKRSQGVQGGLLVRLEGEGGHGV